jgi:hypothetical protein
MAEELKQHYVAFLDVLGFSEMVMADTQSDQNGYLSKLFKCHQSAATIFNDEPSCAVTQFSDSVVIALPYDAKLFGWFVKCIGLYQRMLLDEGLTCRGGIAVNKHFSNASFTFSAGLIDAYHVESKVARYPRVVVSREVLELVFPNSIAGQPPPSNLILEDDGVYFVDYLGSTKSRKPKALVKTVQQVVKQLLENAEPSVKEKGRWLAAYSDAVLATRLKIKRFTRRPSTRRAGS